ncbi:MAG TPA: isoprenylcysteine carboxylmethyltransferase family protein [Rhodothermia bacterium]
MLSFDSSMLMAVAWLLVSTCSPYPRQRPGFAVQRRWYRTHIETREAELHWNEAHDSRSSIVWLALRSLFWTLALPGFFAGYLPWRYFGLRLVVLNVRNPLHSLGILCIVVGTILLGACIWEFARSGRGTLSPADPPRLLVVRGLYRHVRNPMYLSVTLIVLGELVLTLSTALLVYWVAWFAVVNVFVIGYEEPTLRRQFGSEYDRYTREVGRWLPRLRPYTASR